jgi:hypothetical protein
MTVTGEPPQDDDSGSLQDDGWPEEGSELPPPSEITEPEFDDEGSGGTHSQAQE